MQIHNEEEFFAALEKLSDKDWRLIQDNDRPGLIRLSPEYEGDCPVNALLKSCYPDKDFQYQNGRAIENGLIHLEMPIPLTTAIVDAADGFLRDGIIHLREKLIALLKPKPG